MTLLNNAASSVVVGYGTSLNNIESGATFVVIASLNIAVSIVKVVIASLNNAVSLVEVVIASNTAVCSAVVVIMPLKLFSFFCASSLPVSSWTADICRRVSSAACWSPSNCSTIISTTSASSSPRNISLSSICHSSCGGGGVAAPFEDIFFEGDLRLLLGILTRLVFS